MAAKSRKDHLRILELPPRATEAQIKAQYKRLVRVYHPDRIQDPSDKAFAEARLKEINRAYNELLPPNRFADAQRKRTPGAREALPQPVLFPSTLDFGTLPQYAEQVLSFRVDNDGAEAQKFHLHFSEHDSWFRVAGSQSVRQGAPLPVEFKVIANTHALEPGRKYNGWIDVGMDEAVTRLPLSLRVASKRSRWTKLITRSAIIIAIGLLIFLGVRSGGLDRALSGYLQNALPDSHILSAAESDAMPVVPTAVQQRGGDHGAIAPTFTDSAAALPTRTPTVTPMVADRRSDAGRTAVPIAANAPYAVPLAIDRSATPTADRRPTRARNSAGLTQAIPIDATAASIATVALAPTKTSTQTASPSPTPSPSVTPTQMPSPTPSSTATPTATPTNTPTAAPPVAPTAPPVPAAYTTSGGLTIVLPDTYAVNARADISTTSAVLTVFPPGASITAIGRTVDTAWLRIVLPDGRLAWIFAETTGVDRNLARSLPIINP